MKTRGEFTREIARLEKEVEYLKEEVRIHEYCRSHALDYHDSGDYSRAVNGLSKERREEGDKATKLPDGNKTESKLLYSKPVGETDSSCYNGNDTDTRILLILNSLENVSHYGWFNDMGELIKKNWGKVKEKAGELADRAKDEIYEKALDVWKWTGGRRNIRNNTSAEICVTGNTKDHKPKLVYLHSRGENSSPDLYDADGVVILEEQKFYLDESAMRNKGRTYTTGVIKVKDVAFGWGNAEVCETPGEKGTFYVHASGNSYLTLAEADKKKWKLP